MKLTIILMLTPLILSVNDPVIMESDVVTVTVYNAVEEQTDSDPTITAFGYHINPDKASEHRYLAVSRDLEKMFHKGDSVIIEGTVSYDGKWIVADRMNKRWKKRVDLLIHEDSTISKFEEITIRRCSENN